MTTIRITQNTMQIFRKHFQLIEIISFKITDKKVVLPMKIHESFEEHKINDFEFGLHNFVSATDQGGIKLRRLGGANDEDF